MTYIWDEKPEPVWVPRGYYSESKIKDDDVQMLIVDDMDAWLGKGRDYIGNLYNDIAELKAKVDDLDKENEELTEKAEKWDEFCKCLNWLNDPPIEIPLRQFHALNIGNQDKRKKLEAVKTWYGFLKDLWLPELKQILEVEE